MSAIESVLHESRVFPPSAEASARAAISGMDAYRALAAEAERDYEGFWATPRARDAGLAQAVHEGARRIERAVLQVVRGRRAERLVQLPRPPRRSRQRRTRPRSSSRPTTAASRKSPTRSCCARVCRFANALKARGVKKGDRVVIYMPMSVEGVVAMQACARIGATIRWCSAASRRRSLHERIVDAGAVARRSPPTSRCAAARRCR